MELWIRSQNKEHLIKCEKLDIFDRNSMSLVKDYVKDLKLEVMIIANDNTNLGTYKTKERALEVLDEIQDKIKSLLYLKPKAHLKLDDLEAEKRYFEDINGIDFIVCDNNFEIEPITTNVTVYEMPEN